MTDEQLQHLHDQMTRGYQPTPEEQSKLDAWYMRQDQLEDQLLSQSTSSTSPVDLHSQVAATATQLEVVTRHIRDVIAENLLLREEIRALQRRLTHMADKAA
jgi:hypothetical protein